MFILSKLIAVCDSSKVAAILSNEGKERRKKKRELLYSYSCSTSGSVHSDKGEKRV